MCASAQSKGVFEFGATRGVGIRVGENMLVVIFVEWGRGRRLGRDEAMALMQGAGLIASTSHHISINTLL